METAINDMIYLKGGDLYVTDDPDTAYRVISGKIYIYIATVKNNIPGRRVFLCTVNEGQSFPALHFVDNEYIRWCFCSVACEESVIKKIPFGATKPLKKAFSERAGVKISEKLSFENSISDIYNLKLAKEEAFLLREKKNRDHIIEQTDDMIIASFRKESIDVEKTLNGNDLYCCLNILCQKAKIKIADYDCIKKSCGKAIDVASVAQVSGFPYREIVLEPDWYKKDGGYFIAFYENDKTPVACIPNGFGGYDAFNAKGSRVHINRQIASNINPRAFMIYRPFENEQITIRKFFKFCMQEMKLSDILSLLILTIVTALIGTLMPFLNQRLYDEYIYSGDYALILALGALIASFTLGNVFFSVAKSISSFRLSSRVKINTQNAVYHRLFELPELFLRKHESAELATRTLEAGEMAGSAVSIVFGAVTSGISFVVYLLTMLSYSGSMCGVALIGCLCYTAVMIWISSYRVKRQRTMLELDGKTNTIMFQLLGGITKLRMSGTEDRALYEYMNPFVKERKVSYKINMLDDIIAVVSALGINAINIFIYISAFHSENLTTGTFIAFQSAFGMVFGAMSSLIGNAQSFMMITPVYERLKSILETAPENEKDRIIPEDITGEIDIDHVSFSYSKDTPLVIDDISLHISPGEYIGIVGSSGCGKSTLLKLLLGFEKPLLGKIYYNNQDLESMNLKELRKKLGVVLQDGKLIAGSIYDNITITSVNATLKDVQHVIDAVGLKEDISNMPMGLHTVLSEDASTISGGQQQRILIARALINKPKIVYFDEATSALDNITQNIVCDSLDKMKSTRIVIAHRLSTIKKCDRIIVMDKGSIVEQGTYDELMSIGGLFYSLASRQMI